MGLGDGGVPGLLWEGEGLPGSAHTLPPTRHSPVRARLRALLTSHTRGKPMPSRRLVLQVPIKPCAQGGRMRGRGGGTAGAGAAGVPPWGPQGRHRQNQGTGLRAPEVPQPCRWQEAPRTHHPGVEEAAGAHRREGGPKRLCWRPHPPGSSWDPGGARGTRCLAPKATATGSEAMPVKVRM